MHVNKMKQKRERKALELADQEKLRFDEDEAEVDRL